MVEYARLAVGVLGLGAALALAGCASSVPSSAASGSPASARSASAATATSSSTVTVDATGVGGVPIGASRATVEKALLPVLGPPDRVLDGPGCPFATPVEHDRSLFWGDLQVSMTAPTVADPNLRLVGWRLSGRRTPVLVDLPGDVRLDVSTGRDVLAADPKATMAPNLTGGLDITDSALVVHSLAGPQPTDIVTAVSFGIPVCD